MASKRVQRRKSCTSKVGFVNVEAAYAACRSLRSRGEGQTRPYKCRFCGKYHVGHFGSHFARS